MNAVPLETHEQGTLCIGQRMIEQKTLKEPTSQCRELLILTLGFDAFSHNTQCQ